MLFSELYLRTLFNLLLSPLPPGGPGEGPDSHFLKDIYNFGPISARIRGVICLNFDFDLKYRWVLFLIWWIWHGFRLPGSVTTDIRRDSTLIRH